jgi:hypothetical protein
MRFLTLPTLTILAGGLLLAADSHNVTYVGGNIADFAPNTGATLSMNGSKSMELRSPQHSVQVPYGQIQKAELGSVVTHSSEPEAPYRFWALPKRLVATEARQMTVSFANGDGQDQTMTIELSKKSADRVLATIERHSAKVASDNWWGESVWKTTRNKDQWGGAGTIAQK